MVTAILYWDPPILGVDQIPPPNILNPDSSSAQEPHSVRICKFTNLRRISVAFPPKPQA